MHATYIIYLSYLPGDITHIYVPHMYIIYPVDHAYRTCHAYNVHHIYIYNLYHIYHIYSI